ncbi:hypothetical protein M441DRAFT_228910 [Trichoderma asperellum CBS 433.97]|uniref:Uncharacterized protein n=1 Tax=Trichoderma asperellum (strain ATCC 204424 / CBS 433.97 / NBRC 101777) TaxID=1042311 RepID=A0A2T3ZQB1_TRIA4|nr:hypothetical protein M441DRAFT_228910 [Trichoderma asperellum CBS 433.97]PTB47002.1 hypothetical protein M441DRAFT_228910 [Trichoderma asperellum CBS 433.97]
MTAPAFTGLGGLSSASNFFPSLIPIPPVPFFFFFAPGLSSHSHFTRAKTATPTSLTDPGQVLAFPSSFSLHSRSMSNPELVSRRYTELFLPDSTAECLGFPP